MPQETIVDTPEDTRRVPLINSRFFALVDAEDWPKVKDRRWRLVRHGHLRYVQSCVGKSCHVSIHRIVTDASRDFVVDHISGDGLDNRKSNLRLCLSRENVRNARRQSRSKAKYKGITFISKQGLYRAQIMCAYKKINLGEFATPEAAAHAYDDAALKLFGKFARLNFPSKGVAA